LVSDNSDFILSDVEVLSSNNDCRILSQEEKGFTLSSSSSKVCDYRYHVTDKQGLSFNTDGSNSQSSSAIARVAFSSAPEEVTLIPLGLATLLDTELKVDLKTEFAKVGVNLEGFTLSSDLVLPYKNGSSAVADTANATINFIPAPGFQGVDRILFSFTNSKDEVRTGILDIAVSDKPNEGLKVVDSIVYPKKIKGNLKVDIDISPYVTSYDGDDYQLVEVKAFNADVQAKNPDDISNKVFSFEADIGGEYYVSFAVSDHNGGIALGLMQVNVTGPASLWSDIFYKGQVWLAPLTSTQALQQGLEFEHVVIDDDYTPPVTLTQSIVSDAKEYCSARGAEVAEYTKWYDLRTNIDLKGEHNWPIKNPFTLIDDETDDRKYIRVSMTGRNPISDPTSTILGPLCVIDTSLILLPEKSKLEAVANSSDTALVAVKMSEFNIIDDVYVTASLNEGASANLASSSVKVNKYGIAIFEIDSLKAETVTLTAEIGHNKVSAELRFIGDASTGNVSLKATKDYMPFDKIKVMATLNDVNGNAIPNEELLFSSTDPRVYFIEKSLTNEDGEAQISISYNKDEGGDILEHVKAPINVSYNSLSTDNINVTFTGGICGGINNKEDYTSFPERVCVKVIDDSGTMYTSNPSLTFVEYFGLTKDNSTYNAPNTYYDIFPSQGEIDDLVTFTQAREIDENNQANDYCNILSKNRIAGRNNWKLTSLSEIKDLRKNNLPVQEYKWLHAKYSWTSTISEGYKNYIYPLYSTTAPESQDSFRVDKDVTCVSH
ncbi:hypothetical protein AB4430_08545, partial [Vibrio kanaloae]|uniref:hypothetical protein n=1 Tax=Vibrio kanaloae TaxID=170673 RepID=UPI0035525744